MENKKDFNLEEVERCKDFVYFYNHYMRQESAPELTKEKYEQIMQEAEIIRNGDIKMRDRRYGYTYAQKVVEAKVKYCETYGMEK